MLDKIKKNYFLLIITFLFIYFFFNLLGGDRGLLSYVEKKDIFKKLQKNQKELIHDIQTSRVMLVPGHKAELFCLAAEEARELCATFSRDLPR